MNAAHPLAGRARLEDGIRRERARSSRCGGWRPMAWQRGARVVERGYQGLMAKDEASPYVGGVARSWLKVKVPLDGGGRPLTAPDQGLWRVTSHPT